MEEKKFDSLLFSYLKAINREMFSMLARIRKEGTRYGDCRKLDIFESIEKDLQYFLKISEKDGKNPYEIKKKKYIDFFCHYNKNVFPLDEDYFSKYNKIAEDILIHILEDGKFLTIELINEFISSYNYELLDWIVDNVDFLENISLLEPFFINFSSDIRFALFQDKIISKYGVKKIISMGFNDIFGTQFEEIENVIVDELLTYPIVIPSSESLNVSISHYNKLLFKTLLKIGVKPDDNFIGSMCRNFKLRSVERFVEKHRIIPQKKVLHEIVLGIKNDSDRFGSEKTNTYQNKTTKKIKNIIKIFVKGGYVPSDEDLKFSLEKFVEFPKCCNFVLNPEQLKWCVKKKFFPKYECSCINPLILKLLRLFHLDYNYRSDYDKNMREMFVLIRKNPGILYNFQYIIENLCGENKNTRTTVLNYCYPVTFEYIHRQYERNRWLSSSTMDYVFIKFREVLENNSEKYLLTYPDNDDTNNIINPINPKQKILQNMCRLPTTRDDDICNFIKEHKIVPNDKCMFYVCKRRREKLVAKMCSYGGNITFDLIKKLCRLSWGFAEILEKFEKGLKDPKVKLGDIIQFDMGKYIENGQQKLDAKNQKLDNILPKYVENINCNLDLNKKRTSEKVLQYVGKSEISFYELKKIIIDDIIEHKRYDESDNAKINIPEKLQRLMEINCDNVDIGDLDALIWHLFI